MRDESLVGLAILLLLIFFTRMIMERANKHLSDKNKADMVDVFSAQRLWMLGLMFFVIIGFVTLVRVSREYIDEIFVGYIIALLGLIFGNIYVSRKKMIRIDFPKAYIRAFVLTNVIRMVFLTAFFIYIIYFDASV